MFSCPQCKLPLHRIKTEIGVLWACDQCAGRAVNISLLRKHVQKDFINTLWQTVRTNSEASRKLNRLPCPACMGPMIEIANRGVTETLMLDVCKRCQFVWFDKEESSDLPVTPPKPKPPELSPKAREAIAMVKVRKIAEEAQHSENGTTPPDQWWQVAAGLFGLPIEENASALGSKPIATWGIALLVVVISLFGLSDPEQIVATYGLVPSDPWRLGGLTLLASFFLHGGIFHLLSNLYFFVVFGDNVEDYLGTARFIILLILATLGGEFLHIAFSPRPDTPIIGASGGIAGVIVFYALAFPHVRIAIALRMYFTSIRWLRFSAWIALLIWLGMQLFGLWGQFSGFSNISALAHLGGAATGLLMWLIWKKDLYGEKNATGARW